MCIFFFWLALNTISSTESRVRYQTSCVPNKQRECAEQAVVHIYNPAAKPGRKNSTCLLPCVPASHTSPKEPFPQPQPHDTARPFLWYLEEEAGKRHGAQLLASPESIFENPAGHCRMEGRKRRTERPTWLRPPHQPHPSHRWTC